MIEIHRLLGPFNTDDENTESLEASTDEILSAEEAKVRSLRVKYLRELNPGLSLKEARELVDGIKLTDPSTFSQSIQNRGIQQRKSLEKKAEETQRSLDDTADARVALINNRFDKLAEETKRRTGRDVALGYLQLGIRNRKVPNESEVQEEKANMIIDLGVFGPHKLPTPDVLKTLRRYSPLSPKDNSQE